MPSSQSAQTPPPAQRGHHRKGSWEKGASRRSSQEGGQEVQQARERSPFASPFAQVSRSPIDDDQDAGEEFVLGWEPPELSHQDGACSR